MTRISRRGIMADRSLAAILKFGSDVGTSVQNASVVQGAGGVATRPTPPSSYVLPTTGLTVVSTSAALVTALSSGTAKNIIVEDGIYTNAGYVTIGAAHHVYARNLLGAELQFGVQGNVGNPYFQGLKFHVTDPTKTLNGIVMHAWGASSSGWNVLDCTLTGNDSIGTGFGVRANQAYENLIIRRCEARNFHDYGFLIDSNDTAYNVVNAPILEDIYAENCVWQTNPQGSNGVSEAGLWLGNRAVLNRLWCHQVPGYATIGPRGQIKAWQGLWLGTNVRNMTINDVLCTGYLGFGCYGYGPLNPDDVSTITVNRFETAQPVSVGWHHEWNNPNAAHHPNTQNVIVQDSHIDAICVGVHYDTGTKHSTVRRTTFVGCAGAAIDNYQEDVSSPNLYDTSGNDYSAITASAAIKTDYGGNYACWNN